MTDPLITGPAVTDNTGQSRFEATIDGHLAELIYRHVGKRLVLVHTGVPAELGGHGIGGQLVLAAVRKAAADGLTVVPVCPFARRWLESHPDQAATVTIDWKAS
jgi:predicted GNAT family acetyltransferase